MDVLLRELREGPDGIVQYRDTEVSGAAELTIGSAANQRIQLLGLAVAGRHAVIRRTGSRIELFCRRGCSVQINGKKVTSARLRGGEEIEIGATTASTPRNSKAHFVPSWRKPGWPSVRSPGASWW